MAVDPGICGLICPRCDAAEWSVSSDAVRCGVCNALYPVDDGVLRLDLSEAASQEVAGPASKVTAHYDLIGGAHFVGATFADNPLIYLTTRAYLRFLDRHLQDCRGSLLDLGCGDGRLSLWAAGRGFSPVVALDANIASLKRLAREAEARGCTGLTAVCANALKPPVKRGFFDTLLCFEVLYYLVLSAGRAGALRLAADLLKEDGTLVLSEFTRFGRAILDLDAMNIENARQLADRSTRWEKFGDNRLEVFHWSVEELRADFDEAGLGIVAETGVSPASALFSFAWTFTSYPLRPRLDDELRELLETICDHTNSASETARNVVFALRKPAA